MTLRWLSDREYEVLLVCMECGLAAVPRGTSAVCRSCRAEQKGGTRVTDPMAMIDKEQTVGDAASLHESWCFRSDPNAHIYATCTCATAHIGSPTDDPDNSDNWQ